MDEAYIWVKGKWCYLYRAIDRDGNLVDSMLSEKRDMASRDKEDKEDVSLTAPLSPLSPLSPAP